MVMALVLCCARGPRRIARTSQPATLRTLQTVLPRAAVECSRSGQSEALRQILRPLCSDAVVERLARTGDDREGLFAQASDSVRPSVLRKVDRVAVGIPDAGFRLAVGRPFLDVGRGAPLLAHRN